LPDRFACTAPLPGSEDRKNIRDEVVDLISRCLPFVSIVTSEGDSSDEFGVQCVALTEQNCELDDDAPRTLGHHVTDALTDQMIEIGLLLNEGKDQDDDGVQRERSGEIPQVTAFLALLDVATRIYRAQVQPIDGTGVERTVSVEACSERKAVSRISRAIETVQRRSPGLYGSYLLICDTTSFFGSREWEKALSMVGVKRFTVFLQFPFWSV
jgi:hypothetical protein